MMHPGEVLGGQPETTKSKPKQPLSSKSNKIEGMWLAGLLACWAGLLVCWLATLLVLLCEFASWLICCPEKKATKQHYGQSGNRRSISSKLNGRHQQQETASQTTTRQSCESVKSRCSKITNQLSKKNALSVPTC